MPIRDYDPVVFIHRDQRARAIRRAIRFGCDDPSHRRVWLLDRGRSSRRAARATQNAAAVSSDRFTVCEWCPGRDGEREDSEKASSAYRNVGRSACVFPKERESRPMTDIAEKSINRSTGKSGKEEIIVPPALALGSRQPTILLHPTLPTLRARGGFRCRTRWPGCSR